MNDMAEIKANADRLVELTNQQSVIKAEIDEIKAWFEKVLQMLSRLCRNQNL